MPALSESQSAALGLAWAELDAHHRTIAGRHLSLWFAEDPQRAQRYCLQFDGLYCDYSKHRIDDRAMELLMHVAAAAQLPRHIEAMFTGALVNGTEQRAALHTLLRAPRAAVDDAAFDPRLGQVHAVLDRMADFADQVHSGQWLGYSGKPIRAVVNIGIGGSDLGPAMAGEALRHYAQRGLLLRFVANVDGSDFHEACVDLDPAETLFVICSKTFTTQETLTNAHTARDWCLRALGDPAAIARHFVAVSTNLQAVRAFGIHPERMFEFWDWVGGRYSLPSAIGLSTMIAIGSAQFRELLAGMHAMDEHFRHQPLDRNLPVVLALIGIWNRRCFGTSSHAILPYDHYLRRFPAYLQQLIMESNGKQVQKDGTPLQQASAPVVWGEPGSNAQHSFFQLLHQGTDIVPCDLIGFCHSLNPLGEHHQLLLANLLAQAEALAFGRSEHELRRAGISEDLLPHRRFDGNRPSTMLLFDRLTPYVLGQLIALYEHQVYVQAVLWNINPFDQWGVELGKVLAQRTAQELASPDEPELGHDSSTNALIRYLRDRRNLRTGGVIPD